MSRIPNDPMDLGSTGIGITVSGRSFVYIASGGIPMHVGVSRAIASGQLSFAYHPPTCGMCGEEIDTSKPSFDAYRIDLPSARICMKCAGFNEQEKRFYNRKDAIRESIPHFSGADIGIVYDYLIDQNRSFDANYLKDNYDLGDML